MKKLPPGQRLPPAVNGGMLGNAILIDKVPATFLLRITDQNEDPDAARPSWPTGT